VFEGGECAGRRQGNEGTGNVIWEVSVYLFGGAVLYVDDA